MKQSGLMFVMVAACVLLIHQVASHPVTGGLTGKDRQDIMHYAGKIIRIALGESGDSGMTANKRNPGTLDAVLGMPNLFEAGRK